MRYSDSLADTYICAGSRLAKNCGSGSAYYVSIDTCVPSSISGLGVFVSAFAQKKTCRGSVVATSSDLEALRYCNVINGNLSISVSDGSADYTALHDISVITGLADTARVLKVDLIVVGRMAGRERQQHAVA